MADKTAAPASEWKDCTQEDIEEQIRIHQRYARFSHPPFNNWQWVVDVLQDELDEFKASIARGEPDVLELFGLSATAQLAIKEMSKQCSCL